MTGDAEQYSDAEVEIVQVEGEHTIGEQDREELEFQEKIIELQWENTEQQKTEAGDDINSLEEA